MPEDPVILDIEPDDSISGWTAWERDNPSDAWGNPTRGSYAGTLTDGVSSGPDATMYPNSMEQSGNEPEKELYAFPLSGRRASLHKDDSGAAWPPAESEAVFRTGNISVAKFHGGPWNDILTPKKTYCYVGAVNFGDLSSYITPDLAGVELHATVRSFIPTTDASINYTYHGTNLLFEWYDDYGMDGSNYYTVANDWVHADRSPHAIASTSMSSIGGDTFVPRSFALNPADLQGRSEIGIRMTISGDAPANDHHMDRAEVQSIYLVFHYDPDPEPPDTDEWRSTVYFPLNTMPEGQTPAKAELILWPDYIDDYAGVSLYVAPILSGDPEQPPITIPSHAPVPFADKTTRSIWESPVASLTSHSPSNPIVIPVDVSLLNEGMIGFQFGFKDRLITYDWRYSYVDIMKDGNTWGGGLGPRLRLYYGDLDEILADAEFDAAIEFDTDAVVVMLEAEVILEEVPLEPVYIGGEIFLGLDSYRMQVQGTLEAEQRRYVLDHRAVNDRMN